MYYEVNLEIDYKAIGERVKAAREKRGLKQHNLAALAEVAATNISHIEPMISAKHKRFHIAINSVQPTQYAAIGCIFLMLVFVFSNAQI